MSPAAARAARRPARGSLTKHTYPSSVDGCRVTTNTGPCHVPSNAPSRSVPRCGSSPRWVAELVRHQRLAAATEYFLTAALDVPHAVVEQMKTAPFWDGMVAMAPTLRYECAVAGDQRIPVEQLATITQPVLLLAGGDSDAWARDTVPAAAAAIPASEHRLVPGQGHGVDQTVVAPLLMAFFGGR